MKKIRLKRGEETLVDDTDFDFLNQYNWYADKIGNTIYVCSYQNGKVIHMHALIRPDAKLVDHKDGNGLNNQRTNLRAANKSLNGANRLPNQTPKTSRFKGVHLDSWTGRWRATIEILGKRKGLGRFNNEQEAARAYDAAALQAFGEFARTNEMMNLYSMEKFV